VLLRGRLLTDGVEQPATCVAIDDGRVSRLWPADATAVDLDADDGWIAPGLIDLQINGAGGVDFSSAADPEAAVAEVARALVRYGVTGFCPTIVTSPVEAILARLPALAPRDYAGGARSLGAHVEGPFISPKSPGVHDQRHIRPPTLAEIERWLAAGPPPAIVTLAPEVDGAAEAIARLRAARTVVSLGHSAGTAEQAEAGLSAGASMGTHLFTAMGQLHQRAPGLIGGLIGSTAVTGLICDGVHVDRRVCALAIRAAGPERIAIVSDAMAAAGAPPGPVRLGDQTVTSDGVAVRRADGALAGSAAMLDHGLRNAHAWCTWLTRGRVVTMATATPARALGRRARIGVGQPADLVFLDHDWVVRATIVGGELVYRRD
jgi:N-acetylglucosamine-6-phosphate deacetylase